MIFDSLEDARNWFLDWKKLEVSVQDFIKVDTKNWKFGDYILFQRIKENENPAVISRPIYGIFTNFTIWDQAFVMGFIQNNRAWEFSNEAITNKEKGYKTHISNIDLEMNYIIFWSENINLLGHWKSKPSISELKKALSKSIIDRETKIENILN